MPRFPGARASPRVSPRQQPFPPASSPRAARWWITGTWAHFEEQGDAQLRDTLAHWANNDGGFPKLAFKGLTQPIVMAWYVTPEAGRTTGYPGPPVVGSGTASA